MVIDIGKCSALIIFEMFVFVFFIFQFFIVSKESCFPVLEGRRNICFVFSFLKGRENTDFSVF
jgi:hypothetical protein